MLSHNKAFVKVKWPLLLVSCRNCLYFKLNLFKVLLLVSLVSDISHQLESMATHKRYNWYRSVNQFTSKILHFPKIEIYTNIFVNAMNQDIYNPDKNITVKTIILTWYFLTPVEQNRNTTREIKYCWSIWSMFFT